MSLNGALDGTGAANGKARMKAKSPRGWSSLNVIVRADGVEALVQAEARMEGQADDVIGALDAEERETLRDLLARALDAHRAAVAQRATNVGARL